ncbi:Fe3+ hydroxamate ABC transporter substrate-binding protein [Bacillus pumilus]|uniref:Fe3+ hydroxamate ABC transporter substrate-binding protein n=1 Tax=Bacillus pumilus TaxID=1408 RepID=UPI003703DB4B
MFRFEEPTCASCQKKIEANEEVYVKLVYPKRKGMTEVKAWLRNEGVFIVRLVMEKQHKNEHFNRMLVFTFYYFTPAYYEVQ